MSDAAPKINKKKLENLERLRRKKEAKQSKTKLKKLKQIAERKRVKESRDSLIKRLMQHQLDKSFLNQLSSIARPQQNQNQTDLPLEDAEQIVAGEYAKSKRPKKLRCVSGKQIDQIRPKRIQRNHIDTDSSTSEDEIPPLNAKVNIPSTNGLPQIQSSSAAEQSITEINGNECLPLDLSHRREKGQIAKELYSTRENEESLNKRKKRDNFYKLLAKIKGPQIEVARLLDIGLQRQSLPIYAEEQQIVEAINDNTVVIVSGETGSGKTTQIPQFLYEAGYTSNGHLIGVTEPRRVAAISMAERVGRELNDTDLSSYQIRFEGNRTEKTKILFMTDGVLLKELQADCTLSKFSVIVIDEAHERSIYSDVLIGLLSRICLARLKREFPLKLVIMSATLRLDDFLQERLFPRVSPKLISVQSRQYPVTVHFERRTPGDYLEAAFRKVCKIHERLPPGGILIFLSGQREVQLLVRWLSTKYPSLGQVKSKKSRKRSRQSIGPQESQKAANDNLAANEGEDMVVDYEEFGIDDMDIKATSDTDNIPMPGSTEGDELASISEKFPPLYCLPLFSLMPSHLQRRIFEPAPQDGSRLCVVATNVAETSLTIPNIRYVVDSGKEKRRDFDPITGVSRFVVDWISRASAEQRSGRAGRVQAGHTYRLYSSAVFEDFVKFARPEILGKPIEQLVLFLKSMNFTKIVNFPFPTPPNPDQISSAEQCLYRLGALERPENREDIHYRITSLGQTLSQIPLSPQFAKILVLSNHHALLPYTITLVSALSVREPLVPIASIREESGLETQARMAEMLKQRRLWCALGEARLFGDLTVLLHVIGAADYEQKGNTRKLIDLGLRPKALPEIQKLRRQLVNVVNQSESLDEKIAEDFKLSPPTQEQLKFMRQIFTNCLPDRIAKRVDKVPDNIQIPKGAYKCQKLEEFVYIDSTSMLYKEQPGYVVYQEIIQLATKKCMQNLLAVESAWVPDWVNKQLQYY